MPRATKESIRACRFHREVIDETVKRLVARNVVSFDEVIEALSLTAMAHAIRWDMIREIINETTGQYLIPLCYLYFKRHQLIDEKMNPGKYTAGTGGIKKMSGLAWFGDNTSHLFQHNLVVSFAQINGRQKNYTRRRADILPRLADDGVSPETSLLPPPTTLDEKAGTH